MKAAFGLSLALVLSRPGLAQHAGGHGDHSDAKCVGGGEGSKCGGGDYDVRVQFDKESAKGEVKCKEGKILKDGTVVYAKCVQHRLEAYDDIVILKKIIAKEKYAKLDAKKKKLAKKLAFYHSACGELKKELAAMGEGKSGDIEYKKKAGALKKIDKEFDKSLSDCGKEDKEVFTCPNKE